MPAFRLDVDSTAHAPAEQPQRLLRRVVHGAEAARFRTKVGG